MRQGNVSTVCRPCHTSSMFCPTKTKLPDCQKILLKVREKWKCLTCGTFTFYRSDKVGCNKQQQCQWNGPIRFRLTGRRIKERYKNKKRKWNDFDKNFYFYLFYLGRHGLRCLWDLKRILIRESIDRSHIVLYTISVLASTQRRIT